MNPIEYLQESREQIVNGLIQIQSYISAKKENSSDIAFISELFIEELLNLIYEKNGYKFTNLNFDKPNAPVIDIADEKNKICYQVTITNDHNNLKTKIKSTLEGFYQRGWETKYNKLFIIIASGITDKNRIPDYKKLRIGKKSINVNPDIYNKNHVIDLVDLSKDIFKNISSIDLDKIKKTIEKIPSRPIRNQYFFSTNHYIERKIIDNKGVDYVLRETLDKYRRIVLIGVGGLGKTTEIGNIADLLSRDINNYCYKVNLIDYADNLTNLINTKCKYWNNTPSGSELYFFFDGLDEVKNTDQTTLTNELKQFAENNSQIRILITCRNNFNPFQETNLEDYTTSLFRVFKLKVIGESDIKYYASKLSKDKAAFIKSYKSSNLDDLLSNPFYLANAIEIHNNKGIIPENRTSFFQELINIRVDIERSKNPIYFNNINEFALQEGLKTIALSLQFAGTYKINKLEFDQIIPNRQIIDSVKRMFFSQIDNYWRFEHNNFQEFLAAQILSKKDWRIIKNIILLPNNKLKPKWLNAFSFLLSITSNPKLIVQWFIENDINSLSRIEHERIENELREIIFRETFSKHKTEETGIWTSSFHIDQIAIIGNLNNNEELVRYLINEFKNGDNADIVRTSCLYLFKEIKSPIYFPDKLQEILFGLLDGGVEVLNKYSSIVVDILLKWNWTSKRFSTKILQNNLLIKSNPHCVINFLANSNINIDSSSLNEILESLNQKRVIGKDYQIKQILIKMSAIEFKKLIDRLTVLEKDELKSNWFNDFYDIITDISIEKYESNPNIAESISSLAITLFDNHRVSEANKFYRFYERHDLISTYFKKHLKDDLKKQKVRRNFWFALPALLANKKCVDWAMNYFISLNIKDDLIWNFIYSLYQYNKDSIANYFKEEINKLTNNRFVPPVNPTSVFEENIRILWQDILVNQKLALKYINLAFSELGEGKLMRREVVEKSFDQEFKFFNVESYIGLKLILELHDSEIEKKQFINWFTSKENWEWFASQQHLRLLKNEKLNKKNLAWIKNWTISAHKDIKIEDTIIKHNDGGVSYSSGNSCFIEFVLFLDYDLTNEEMLSLSKLLGLFDFNTNYNYDKSSYSIYEYLCNKLSIGRIHKQIILNLENKDLIPWVLDSHISIIRQNKILNAIDLFPKYLIKPETNINTKLEMLSTFREHNRNPKELIALLKNVTFEGEIQIFDWNLIEFLTLKSVQEVIPVLNSFIGKPNIDQLKIGTQLTDLGELNGFKIIIENLNTNYEHDDFRLLYNTISHLSTKTFDKQMISGFLFDILKKSIEIDYTRYRFFDLPSVIISKWLELITNDSLDEKLLIQNINKYLNTCEKNESYLNYRYAFKELQSKVDIFLDKSKSINDAITCLKTQGFDYNFH